jgi:hypothetical protein
MQQRSRESDPPFSSIPGVDPFIDWAFGPGREFFVFADLDLEWLPVLIELRGMSARRFAGIIEEKSGQSAIRIPSLYTEPPAALEDSPHCTALVTERFFELLKGDDSLQGRVARVSLGPPLRPEPSRGFGSDSS